jgi:hypothetical protein
MPMDAASPYFSQTPLHNQLNFQLQDFPKSGLCPTAHGREDDINIKLMIAKFVKYNN